MSPHAPGLGHVTAQLGAGDLQGHGGLPAIAALQRYHDRLRVAELERARQSLAGGTPAAQVLEELARRLTNKVVHAPTQALNKASDAERAELLSLFHRIYQLSGMN